MLPGFGRKIARCSQAATSVVAPPTRQRTAALRASLVARERVAMVVAAYFARAAAKDKPSPAPKPGLEHRSPQKVSRTHCRAEPFVVLYEGLATSYSGDLRSLPVGGRGLSSAPIQPPWAGKPPDLRRFGRRSGIEIRGFLGSGEREQPSPRPSSLSTAL